MPHMANLPWMIMYLNTIMILTAIFLTTNFIMKNQVKMNTQDNKKHTTKLWKW